ncbi:IclR family transcriptional regulator [Leucobacter sp. W1478]|uniref:IclR family transcriptional regulator n=1 Tax=Leucobacter sp. W1478 TaxID=3439065 RepID=UPI003F3EC15F
MSGTESGGVQSVERAFDVLEALAQAERELTVAEVAAATHLAAPTAHRLLRTLVSRGYVQQAASRGYTLGSGLIHLGKRATPELATLAQGVLADLEEASEETANLAVLDGDLVAYIAQMPSRHRMRMFTEVGRRVLPHASGVGKAILSTLPDTRVREIVARTGLPRYTPSTLVTDVALLADLRESRRRGFAVDDGEQEVGVRCIAVPIPGSSPAAAVSISGPVARVTDAKSNELTEALMLAAASLAEAATRD